MKGLFCGNCGSEQVDAIDGVYVCRACKRRFKEESVREKQQALRELFGEALFAQKEEQIANLRRNLWREVHEKYLSSQRISDCCKELKKLVPDDFQANFYETAVSGTARQLNKFLDSIDETKENDFVEDVVEFVLRSLESKNVTALKNLITRAFKGEKYIQYITAVEDEAARLDSGIYVAELPRDVFVAYSSADAAAVNEVTELLEENGLTCFVALRNLRHGKGAVENYQSRLETAMHNAKCVVFLSSENSRNLDCDALKIELPYFRDFESGKGRIEYVIEEYG